MDATPNQGDSSPFNRTAQHDAKRAAILSQAAKLFNSKGSRATTLKDIAESLGLTKTSLYYYVKTKEELIYQCYMAALEHHHATLDEIERNYADPLERASAFFLQQFESWLAARDEKDVHIAALLEIASLKGPHREEVEKQYIRMFTRLRQYLRDGVSSGVLRQKLDPTSATRAILGSMEWIFYWLHSVDDEEVRRVARQAMNILAHGLCADGKVYEPVPLSFENDSLIGAQGFNREQQNRLKQMAFYKTGTWFFNKKGFDGSSLDEIAEHLNVSKGAFYYHIKNKEDLLFNCYSYSLDTTERIYDKASHSQGTGLQQMEEACRRIFHVQNTDDGPLVRYNTITSLPADRRKLILKRTNAANSRFGDFIRRGIDDGSLRDESVFIAQNLITGAINASMDIKLWRKVDNIDEAAIDYFDVFLNGLLPRN
ncbi:MAG: TetR/AcrR family transcriptional regulator [Halioglobus sp.]